jgi:hypothetical protein
VEQQFSRDRVKDSVKINHSHPAKGVQIMPSIIIILDYAG